MGYKPFVNKVLNKNTSEQNLINNVCCALNAMVIQT